MNKREMLDYVVWSVCAVLIVVILVVIPSLERDPKERGTTEAVTEAKTEPKTERATEAVTVEIVQTEPPEEVKRAELARIVGVSVASIYSMISKSKRYGWRCKYIQVRVPIDGREDKK